MKNYLIPLLISLCCGSAASAKDELTAVLSGNVTTTAKQPMANVQVVLLDQNDMQLANVTTDARGSFSIKHVVCKRCALEVIPALDTHYACAVIRDIPGSANRNFLLTLQRGFTITGRVTANKKGLKGVQLTALTADPTSEGTQVHDGGIARTGRNGTFSMILTPGHKRIEVLNDKNVEFQRTSEVAVDVTSDAQIPDIELKAMLRAE